jgi:hypothetical protein
MSSTVIKPIATLIATMIDGLSVDLTAHTWEPGKGLVRPPCALIGVPSIEQVGIEEADYEVGVSAGWVLNYPIAICFDLDKFPDCADDVVDATEEFLKAVNDNPLLGFTPNANYAIQEAHVTNVEKPAAEIDAARPLLITECELEVLALIP